MSQKYDILLITKISGLLNFCSFGGSDPCSLSLDKPTAWAARFAIIISRFDDPRTMIFPTFHRTSRYFT